MLTLTSSTVDQRYGARRPGPGGRLSRRSGSLLAVLALLLATAFIAWAVAGQSSAPTVQEVSFDVSAPDRASLDFELTKDQDQTVRCAIQALNDQHAIVGWTEITVGKVPEAQRTGRTSAHHVQLRTTSASHTVTVDSCWEIN